MTKRLLQLASILIFAGLVMGAGKPKKVPIKVEDCVVLMKTEGGEVKVSFKTVFDLAMKEHRELEFSVNRAKLTKRK